MKILITALLLAATTATAAAFDFDKTPGRLPKNVVPLDYAIAFKPNMVTKTMTGAERITLLVRQSTNRIVFNTLNQHLSNVRVDGVPAQSVVTQNGKQLSTVTVAHTMRPGHHVLTLAYTGLINTTPQGLFAQPYRTPSGSGVLLTSQLESTDARRFFPCWDEPAFRARFTLTATIPAAWSVVGNMPIAHRVVHGSTADVSFRPTPKMSTYLVEFTAGNLAYITARNDGYTHSVWAVRGEEHKGRDALAASQTILNDYNAYFGFRFPLPKLDSIAIPGGFPGAMENWGAITYNDQLLLTGPSTTISARQIAWDVQAHEMSHQWTGDLVTIDWWSDIWLAESFATWMETKETALRHPSWAWWEMTDGEAQDAFDADGQPTSIAIESPVKDELQAEASFNPAIVYTKGRSVLRMLEEYLGEDTFRDGMRRYIRANAYSNTVGSDLWRALSAESGQDVAALGSAWIKQPGYPTVFVRAQCDASGNRTIALSQKRFLWEGNDAKGERWNVPLQIQSGNGDVEKIVLKDDGQTVTAGTCDQPLLANAGGYGFYRVAYDKQTLANDTTAFGSFSNPDKISLLDDQWAFARAGKAGLGPYFDMAAKMGSDYDARAWEQIIASLTTFEQDERGLPRHADLLRRSRELLSPLVKALGWNIKPGEAPPIRDLRNKAILALGQFGDPAVIGEARRRFAIFEHNHASLSPDQQGTVLPVVAAYADPAMFERLHKVALTARDVPEVGRFYGALVTIRDPKLAAMALQAVMTDPLPPQAQSNKLRLIFESADWNPKLSWTFFERHGPDLLKDFSEFDRALFMADALPDIYKDAEPPSVIAVWVQARSPAGAAPYIKRGLAAARVKLAEKARLVAELNAELSHTSRN
ncbi:MAG TPA: M1 family metallopeptidase [Candidatus Baltobacteraceae bacterium]|jgi:aminopeptidase N